jgi:hypothetical protein
MKNSRFEQLGRMQRQYHRHHQWKLSRGGLFIPHSYAETKPDNLSLWGDVGFILNGRRVIVWWQHPRHVYFNAIEDLSRQEAGEDPGDDWLIEGSTPKYRKVGRSRKKIISYTSRPPSDEQRLYYERLRAIQKRMAAEGIDFDVAASWKRVRLNWATGIRLVAPMEVRNEAELSLVAALARRLILGQTTLDSEFPGYRYGKTDWLRERASFG